MKSIFLLIIILIIRLFGFSAYNLEPIENLLNGAFTNVGQEENQEKAPANNILFKDENGNIVLDSSDISLISKGFDGLNGDYIQIELTEKGTADFAKATRENIGKQISIVLNDEVLLAPTVQEEITEGKLIISNQQSYDEMMKLFDKLTN